MKPTIWLLCVCALSMFVLFAQKVEGAPLPGIIDCPDDNSDMDDCTDDKTDEDDSKPRTPSPIDG